MKLARLAPSFLLLPLVGLPASAGGGARVSTPSAAEEAEPPLPTHPRRATSAAAPALVAGARKAVLLRSWNGGQASVWERLNATWPLHGSTPLVIDTTSLSAVASFTYADLAASGADVIVLSDPAGGLFQLTHAEVAALQRYVDEGHDLVATFLTFRHRHVDNSELLPLFGLRADVEIEGREHAAISNEFIVVRPDDLLRGLPATGWSSSGYAASQVEKGGRWTAFDQREALLVASSDEGRAIVSVFRHRGHAAVYVSSMPEYDGSPLDERLLYNALTLGPAPARSASGVGVSLVGAR